MNTRSAIDAIDDQATPIFISTFLGENPDDSQIEEEGERNWEDSKAREEGTRL